MAAPVVHEEPTHSETLTDQTVEASTGFVGRWQTLISTTNWEKGRIICEWRRALQESDAPITQYSDEAWAQMVGDVTGQHVGRLRRTFERFGDVSSEYEGLYWSHFQIAHEWNDAEMWLEGALQNGWSVSQMRAQRWETVGEEPARADSPTDPVEGASAAAELDEHVTPEEAEVRSPGGSDNGAEPRRGVADDSEELSSAPAAERREPVRPMKDLAELPEDLAEAFEQFKLAILTHKLTGWAEVSRDDVLAALAALEQLALAPSGE